MGAMTRAKVDLRWRELSQKELQPPLENPVNHVNPVSISLTGLTVIYRI
jgi:hypothetical protein